MNHLERRRFVTTRVRRRFVPLRDCPLVVIKIDFYFHLALPDSLLWRMNVLHMFQCD